MSNTNFTDEEIRNFVELNQNNPELIRQKAIDTGTSIERIEAAINAPEGWGNQWLADRGLDPLPSQNVREYVLYPTSGNTSDPAYAPINSSQSYPDQSFPSSAIPTTTTTTHPEALPSSIPTTTTPTTTAPTTTTPTTTTPTTTTITANGGSIRVPQVQTPGQAITDATGITPTEHLLGIQASPNIPHTALQRYTPLVNQRSQELSIDNPNFIADPQAANVSATAEAAVQSLQDNLDVNTVTASMIGEGAAGSEQAATGTVSALANMTPAQGNISVLAEAAQGTTPPEALVTKQLEGLLQGIEDGNIPAWAQPAVDAVEQQLAARGMSRSSVGQAALTNAIIQSATTLASQNAQVEAQTFWNNLENRQQTAIVNAQNLAQMDISNLNARQQAQVSNAQSFLQMDLTNLSNEQQMTMFDAQVRQQSYLSDQAAANAASQFNATSQNQVDQFITNLNATIEQQNAARVTAVSEFNAQQENAIAQFNTTLEAQREQFNVQNNIAIEQANVAWRRQINQANTAGVNAVNQANAMNAFNLSNQALTFLWQEYRDQASWEFDANQNQSNRETQLVMAALGNEAATDSTNSNAIAELGAAAFNFFDD